MKYDRTNCAQGCSVTDEYGAELREVESVDTDSRVVVQYEMPLRLVGDEWEVRSRAFVRASTVAFDRHGKAVSIRLYGLQP